MFLNTSVQLETELYSRSTTARMRELDRASIYVFRVNRSVNGEVKLAV